MSAPDSRDQDPVGNLQVRPERISKAPRPPSEVGGRGETHGPKPAEMLSDLPVDYPRILVARTFVIIAEAVRKFPVQTQILELGKYVISELTPLFREALQKKELREDQGLFRMDNLLHYLLVQNCDDGGGRLRIQKELLKSDEWLVLAREMARPIDCGAPGTAGSIQLAEGDLKSFAFKRPERLSEGQPAETNALSLTVCAVCGHYEAHHDQEGCFLDPQGKSSQDPGILSRSALKKTGALCWCPRFIADFSQAADLICESGNFEALKHGVEEAITRRDSRNAHRLLDRLIIKTAPAARDLDWIRAVERSIAGVIATALIPGTADSAKPGRALARSPDFVNLARTLWLNAMGQGGNSTVKTEQLKQIASSLDERQFVPPAEYLEESCGKELKAFNSKHSNSEVGPVHTWSRLVTVGDKDHLRGMRKLLSRCARKQALP